VEISKIISKNIFITLDPLNKLLINILHKIGLKLVIHIRNYLYKETLLNKGIMDIFLYKIYDKIINKFNLN